MSDTPHQLGTPGHKRYTDDIGNTLCTCGVILALVDQSGYGNTAFPVEPLCPFAPRSNAYRVDSPVLVSDRVLTGDELQAWRKWLSEGL